MKGILSALCFVSLSSSAWAAYENHYTCTATDKSLSMKIEGADRSELGLKSFDSVREPEISVKVTDSKKGELQKVRVLVLNYFEPQPEVEEKFDTSIEGQVCRLSLKMDKIQLTALVDVPGLTKPVAFLCSNELITNRPSEDCAEPQ